MLFKYMPDGETTDLEEGATQRYVRTWVPLASFPVLSTPNVYLAEIAPFSVAT